MDFKFSVPLVFLSKIFSVEEISTAGGGKDIEKLKEMGAIETNKDYTFQAEENLFLNQGKFRKYKTSFLKFFKRRVYIAYLNNGKPNQKWYLCEKLK
ncbi:MAG: hypothetical protein SFT90_06990 [Rickettsiales bacterium]|nr:hypothetical protein [Rickettsiales bacterium]